MGAIGLPGRLLRPPGAVVRAAFHKLNSPTPPGRRPGGPVLPPSGRGGDGAGQRDHAGGQVRHHPLRLLLPRRTGIYYFKTYDNNRLTAVRLRPGSLEGGELRSYPLRTGQDVFFEN